MTLIRSSIVIVLALAAGSPVIGAPEDVLVPKEQRTPAPKLVFSDIAGARRHLLQFKGKIVVVNFWATWCGPCKMEMPEFVKTYPAYRDRGVEFVGAANEPHEVPWMRRFAVFLGATAPATVAALAAFFVGFGLGSYLLGRLARRLVRPLRAFAVLEITTGASSLAVDPELASAQMHLGIQSGHSTGFVGRPLKARLDAIRSAPLDGTIAASVQAEHLAWRDRGAEIWEASLLSFEGTIVLPG